MLESSDSGSLEKIAFETADAVSEVAKNRPTIEELKAQLDAGKRELNTEERPAIESKLEQLTQKPQRDALRAEKDNKNNDTAQKPSS